MPEFPQPPLNFRPVGPIPGPDGSFVQPELTPEQREFEEAQRRYQEEYRLYEEKRADYHRNVFLIAMVIGFVAVGVGIALSSQLDAIRLGLVAGGLGTMLYAVIQSGGDLDEAGSALIFIVAAIGLVIIVASGYRWLARQDADAPARQDVSKT
jgi:lipopolysaccharide export LptBFGC system permease protein LptF